MRQPSERRRTPRRPASEAVAIVVESDPAHLPEGAFALDLSHLGARLRSRLKLQPGQIVTIVPRGDPTAGIPSQVVWVSEAEGEADAGLAFLQPLKASL